MSPRKKASTRTPVVEEEVSVEASQLDAAVEPNAQEAPVDAPVKEETTPKLKPKPEPEKVETPARVKIVYEGRADVVKLGEYKFRPGQPVTVPSDVAEELLTYPFERFRKE